MMPHPENLIDPLVGGIDGRGLFESLICARPDQQAIRDGHCARVSGQRFSSGNAGQVAGVGGIGKTAKDRPA